MEEKPDDSISPQSAGEEIEKPVKKRNWVWTEKRQQAWEKAKAKRTQNIQNKKDEKVKAYIAREVEKKKDEATTKSKQTKKTKPLPIDVSSEEEESCDDETDTSSDNSYEVVLQRKKRTSKATKRRSPPKEKTYGDYTVHWV